MTLTVGQIVRIGAGVVLLAVAIAIYAPGIFGAVSSNAILNAPTIPVLSPIEGIITTLRVDAGDDIRANGVLVEIVNPAADATFLHQLQAELEAIRGRVAASRKLDGEFAVIQDLLSDEFDRYRDAAIARAKARLNEAIAAREAAAVSVTEAEQDLLRKQSLASSGTVTAVALQTAENALSRLAAELKVADANLERARTDLAAVQAGTFVTDQGQDVPYSKQRADELAVRRADAAAQRSELLTRQAELERLIAIETQQAALRRHAVVRAPRQGIVWRLNVVEGSRVTASAPLATLIDCRDVIVQAQFPGRRFETMQPGTPARVRVLGSDGVRKAHIRDVRAMGASDRTENLAAQVPALDREEFLATFTLEDPPRDLDRDARSFCDAGRAAEVTVGDRESFVQQILAGAGSIVRSATAAER